MSTVFVDVKVPVSITIEKLAELFCDLDDDGMAKFFVAVAAKAETWEKPADFQWAFVAEHLVTCECSSHDAREMIRSLAYHLEEAERDV